MADEEKSLPATERRISKAREEGQIAMSRELLAALSMGAGFLALFYLMPTIGNHLRELMAYSRIQATRDTITLPDVIWFGWIALKSLGLPVLTILGCSSAVAMISGLLSTDFNYTTKPLEPSFKGFDVISRVQQIFFSAQPWVSLIKGLLICLLLIWSVWSTVSHHIDAILLLSGQTIYGQASFLSMLTSSVLQRAVPLSIGIGFLDLIYQRWHMEQQLMMSHQEVKDEHRDTEGDPQIRQRRRQRARQMSMRQSIANVANADVIVTNPTHYAVALRYRREENAAPVVVARGVDHIALKIRQEAALHDIMIIENRPLARALYAKTKAGSAIPSEFYAPVAEVLAVVFKKRRRKAS